MQQLECWWRHFESEREIKKQSEFMFYVDTMVLLQTNVGAYYSSDIEVVDNQISVEHCSGTPYICRNHQKCKFFPIGRQKTALLTVLSQIDALSSIKFICLKLWLCKKMANMRYSSEKLNVTQTKNKSHHGQNDHNHHKDSDVP